jgi:hypothetical protein
VEGRERERAEAFALNPGDGVKLVRPGCGVVVGVR